MLTLLVFSGQRVQCTVTILVSLTMTHGGIQLVPNAPKHVLSTNLDINAINAIG
jgi:hypothetical protein